MTRKKDPAGELPPLSDLELDVMNVVWQLGECSSTEVITAYRKQRHLADTTIRTVLTNIRKKGYIETVPSVDRGYRFRPTVSRTRVAHRTMKGLLSKLFDNSPQEAIRFLISDSDIDDRELDEIRRFIDRHKSRAGEGDD
jgi:BlaI family penicillinase repressor